ncbi:hypothetical protein F4818DRAFT_57311 [Hypoxylon cercidicola]|nr:hypothetical protein F4818DRAFT_57311 [Hypoxylon cercidicola]
MFSRQRWSFSSATRHSESSKHHRDKDRDSRRHHSKRRDPSPEGKKIELLDLDYTLTGRKYIQALIKETIQLDHVSEFLKTKFPSGDQRIPEDAEVRFFWNGKGLDGDDIPKEASILHYRVLLAGDDGSLRVIWRGANLKLRKAQLDTITSEVAAGRSVGNIRETIAELLRVTNKASKNFVQTPNQIVIEAVGGLRPGPLPGNNWEASKVQTWLCRYLAIDLKRPTSYLVLKGFNEEYVCHRSYVDSRGYVDVHELKQWLKQSVLTTVHSRGLQRRGIGVGIDVDDIRLIFRGKPVRKHSHIRPGKIVDFDVPRVVEDKFIQAEAWLVPLSETCIVCSDEKRVSEMPNRRRITASCEHDSSICKECVGQWIVSSMDTVTWDRLKCPECPQLLKYENVRAFALREVFNRYDTLAAKALLANIPDFMWCLNPKCSSGQIYPNGCSRARCHDCKHSLCVRHHIPWHSGETCDEYERRTKRQRKNDKASENHVKEIAKPCPGCKKNVNKFIGCDHVTCICGHEWCWLCFGTYYRDEHEFLQCRHTQQCRYHDNPPNYEGGRAFMPFLNPGGAPGPFMNGALPPRERRPHAPPPPGAPGNRQPHAPRPAPPHGLDDEIFNILMRRHMERNRFDPNMNMGRPRHQNPLGPDFVGDALLFNLGHLMQRVGRER